MPHLEANDAAIDAMRTLDPTESIVMLNLLKFRDIALDGFGVDGMTGGQAFRRYGELNDSEDVKFGANPFGWAFQRTQSSATKTGTSQFSFATPLANISLTSLIMPSTARLRKCVTQRY